MRQLTFIKKRTLQWRDVAVPKLELPTDVIARPLAAARCDGDKVFLFYDANPLIMAGVSLHYVDPAVKNVFGAKPFRGPFAIGHECVAEVISCGEEVKKFKPRDKVIVPWAISCGSCSHCLTGLTSKCLDAGETMFSAYGFGHAMGRWGGMISDTIRVPFADNMLVNVPNGIDPVSLSSASDNIPDGWRTVAPHLKSKPGAPVLIMGGAAGSVGLYAAGIAVALGASEVDYIDYSKPRLDIARSLGANAIEIPERGKGKWYRNNAPAIVGKYPIVSDCCMDEDGLKFAIRSLAPGGICTSAGYYFKRGTPLPMMQMYGNDSTFHTGVSHARATLPDVLSLISSGKFKPEKVTTLLSKWEDADQAFLERTTKVVVHRPSIFVR
jgi:threonine dehydrogenase-like Zn-dependent dehydrogenase